MARQIRFVLGQLGHTVETIASPRTHRHVPEADFAGLVQNCQLAAERLSACWQMQGGAPDLWLTYHNYHKAPDLVGPHVSDILGIPLILIEASHTPSKLTGPWALRTQAAMRASQKADLHLYFTSQDKDGLTRIVDEARLLALSPFIDTGPFQSLPIKRPRPVGAPLQLVSMAMMRHGGKMASYMALAQALACLPPTGWHLTLIGDGSGRTEIEAAFKVFGSERVTFAGHAAYEQVPALLAGHDIFCWPGLHEPFGLVYLEAQAAGLPIVAFRSGGVPETVSDGQTALLVPEGDGPAFAAALLALWHDRPHLAAMSQAARRFALNERDLTHAGRILASALARAAERHAIRRASVS